MAKIIENSNGRRTIRLSTDDIINIVREYQNINANSESYEIMRNRLNQFDLYIPEDMT